MSEARNYYVYIHTKADTNDAFYVGIGKGNRAWKKNKSSRSNEWMDVYNSHGRDVNIYADDLTREEAEIMEVGVIADYLDAGFDLVNKSAGGHGGACGVSRSIETRIKLRDINGGRAVYCSNGMMFLTAKDAQRWLVGNGFPKASSRSVTSCCHGDNVTAYGFAWSYAPNPVMPDVYGAEKSRATTIEKLGRKVVCSSGEIFPSIRSAALEMAARFDKCKDSMRSAISNCLKGKSKTCCGMNWQFVGE